jgi:serine phosphatase RsbU (regulator of sigma subunit)
LNNTRMVTWALLLCVSITTQAVAQAIDLSAADAYVRSGFSLSWVKIAPHAGDAAWTVVPGNAGNRPLVIRNLGLDGSPKRSLFRLDHELPRRYTVAMRFTPGEGLLDSKTGIGLYLAQIGQNWQVYLNGELIRDETYLSEDGTIKVERAVRGAIVEVDPRYLLPGENVIAFMIAGDPLDDRTGMYMGAPYLIDEYGSLEAMRREDLKLIIIGIYFFFALYHAILFMLRPKVRSYLYYCVATGLLSVFLFSRTMIVYNLILDTRLLKNVELTALFLLMPAFLAFFDSALAGRVSVFTKAYSTIFGVAGIVRIFFWSEPLLRLWQYSVVVPLCWVVAFDIIVPIVRSYRKRVQENPRRGMRNLFRSMADTPAGKMLLGAVVVGIAVVFDVIGLNSGRSVMYSDYAFLLLVFGTAATLAGQFVSAYKRSELLGADLHRRVEARSAELESTLASQEALSIALTDTNRQLQERVDASVRDMRVATRVQQGFFPGAAPRTDEWESAFVFMPANGISGDFYDFYMRARRLEGLVVGDVSGHGIASGLITVLARSLFHRNFHEMKKRSLGAILESINDELILELSSVENFVTAALLRMGEGGSVEYASAAHADILYKGHDKTRAVPLKPRGGKEFKGPPLGRAGIESPYTSIRFTLRHGDAILIYTDGFDEARNVDGEPFGMEGVIDALSSAPEGDVASQLEFIVREWRFHVSGTRVADDATAILLRRTGAT